VEESRDDVAAERFHGPCTQNEVDRIMARLRAMCAQR